MMRTIFDKTKKCLIGCLMIFIMLFLSHDVLKTQVAESASQKSTELKAV